MQRFRSCLMVGFIFACGFLVGGFVGAAVGWTGLFHKITRGGPTGVAEILLERAARDLRLSGEQRKKVGAIIAETGAELRDATAETQPRVQQIMARNTERIRAELTPEQRRKFDTFTAQAGRRWQAILEARFAGAGDRGKKPAEPPVAAKPAPDAP